MWLKSKPAAGSFNGNEADNVVTVIANEEGGVRISIPLDATLLCI